jgi:hypothetical protein
VFLPSHPKEATMSSYKPLPLAVPLRPQLGRYAAAAVLRAASVLLAALAQRLAAPMPASEAPLPAALEFYADAGAPEGALYLDGELVGYLPGVRRL